MSPCADHVAHQVLVEEISVACGGADHHIRLEQFLDEGVEASSGSVDLSGECFGPLDASVQDDEACARLCEGLGRTFTHLARSDEKRASPLELAKDFLSELTRDRAHTDRPFGDGGLGTDAFGRSKTRGKEAREEGPDGFDLGRRVEGFLELTEDLRLSDDERVEA